MTPEQEKIFKEKFKEELKKAGIQGMMSGMSVASKVIYDKVVNIDRKYTKNDLLRAIKDVREFCEKRLNTDKKTTTK